jgi:hypothetical protein
LKLIKPRAIRLFDRFHRVASQRKPERRLLHRGELEDDLRRARRITWVTLGGKPPKHWHRSLGDEVRFTCSGPKRLRLLDNDFFCQSREEWQARIREIVEGRFRVNITQGINIRLIDDECAAALASIQYRDTKFERRSTQPGTT